MKVAAIDQGTTSTRVLVANGDAASAVVHSVRHAQHHPNPGWVEHSPGELLSNVKACLDAAGDVDAIGICNQGESCLAWDALSGEPLSPVIVWQDNRTVALLDDLRSSGAEEVALERAGLPLDPYFSASKFAWLLRNNATVQSARRAGRLRLGTTDAYFLDQLTGRFVTDASTASRTLLMNLRSGQWDEELCALFSVPIESLPEITSSVGDFGGTGGAPVTASIVDQQAALYGHGCRKPGESKITFGTGAFALSLTGDTPISRPADGVLPTVAWKIGQELTYALDGGVYDASSAVEWAGRIGLYSSFDEISSFQSAPAASRGLVFVPALSGLACPRWDRRAAALWIGMQASTTKSDLCQAVLEGVAFCTAEVIASMARSVPMSEEISVDGGLSQSGYFVQFLADILGRAVVTRQSHEMTGIGCAALARSGLGATDLDVESEPASKVFVPQQSDATVAAWAAYFSEAIGRSIQWR